MQMVNGKHWAKKIPDAPSTDLLISTQVIVNLGPESRWFHYEVQQNGTVYSYEVTRLTFFLSNADAFSMMGERIYQSGSRTQPQHLMWIDDEERAYIEKVRKAVMPKVIADASANS